MKTVLVTGAAGFLGSHLVMHHLLAGDNVVGIDNFSSSKRKSSHFLEMRMHKNFDFINEDICEPFRWWNPRIVDVVKLDLIYNFACPASPPRYQEIPVETMLTCVLGTRNVLDLAKKTGAIVVHASTSEVYGDPTCSPQAESYKGCVNSYGPRSCYDEGKRAAEALCYDYLNKHNVDARLVRIFNTYGPHMDPSDGRVVSNFICQALRGEQLTLYGDGSQGRSFCYVDDLIGGITSVATLASNPGKPINLGNPNEFTVGHLAALITHKISTTMFVSPLRLPLPVDDPTQRCPDITLAGSLLGWEPRVQLDEGLDKTIAYFRQALKM